MEMEMESEALDGFAALVRRSRLGGREATLDVALALALALALASVPNGSAK
jgi:hypothetical protein